MRCIGGCAQPPARWFSRWQRRSRRPAGGARAVRGRQAGVLLRGSQYDDPAIPAMTGQMYVDAIPARQRQGAVPIVMIHGGAHTGRRLPQPAGRRARLGGYFLRRGWPVYVVDPPASLVAKPRTARRAHLGAERRGPLVSVGEGRPERAVAPGQPAHPAGPARDPTRGCTAIPSSTSTSPTCRRRAADRRGRARQRHDRAARADRSGDLDAALGPRTLGLAHRRRAARPGEGDRVGRAQRPAVQGGSALRPAGRRVDPAVGGYPRAT